MPLKKLKGGDQAPGQPKETKGTQRGRARAERANAWSPRSPAAGRPGASLRATVVARSARADGQMAESADSNA